MRYARWLPFPSASVAAVAFFLPWFAISCKNTVIQTKQKIAFSGYHFASGKMPPVVEGMLQVQQKLAGFGNMMMSFFKKKSVKPKPVVKKKDPLTILRNGFPSFWGALASFGIAALLGLWFAIRGPTPWLRIAGILAILVGIGCLLYPAINRPHFQTPRMNVKMVSVQLELGGYLLLSGILGSLFGFLATPKTPTEN